MSSITPYPRQGGSSWNKLGMTSSQYYHSNHRVPSITIKVFRAGDLISSVEYLFAVYSESLKDGAFKFRSIFDQFMTMREKEISKQFKLKLCYL